MDPRPMSRRKLLQTGSLLVLGSGLLAACGGAATPTAAPASKPAAAEPTKPAAVEPTKPAAAQATKPAAAVEPTKPAAAAAATPAAKPAAAGSGGQFTFFHYEWEGHGVGLANRWIKPADAFEKATGIKIIRKSVPSTEYWTKMVTELAAGTTTEVYYARFNAMDQYRAMDAIVPIDSYCDTKKINETFYPAQKQYLVQDGKTWSILVGLTSSALFYNQKIFDDAGLKPPTSYDEMLDTAKKLTKAPNQYGLGVVTADQVQILEIVYRFLAGYGTQWGDGKAVKANAPATVEAITKLKALVDAGVTPMNQNNPVFRPMYWEGKLAMWMDGPWMPGMTDKEIVGLATAKVPLPTGKSTGGVQNLILTKGGQNKEIAGKYFDWIAQPEWAKVMTVESGNPAGVAGVDYTDYIKTKPWIKTFFDELPNVVVNPAPGWDLFNEQYTKIGQNKMAEMYAKNRDPKTVLDEIQTEFEKLVAQNLK